MVGKPPFAQDNACSTLKLLPQPHLLGKRAGIQPYRRARASWKADLCSVKPCSVKGRAVSQVEDPFSFDSATAFWSLSGSCV